jgi:hypothetical protein
MTNIAISAGAHNEHIALRPDLPGRVEAVRRLVGLALATGSRSDKP